MGTDRVYEDECPSCGSHQLGGEPLECEDCGWEAYEPDPDQENDVREDIELERERRREKARMDALSMGAEVIWNGIKKVVK